MFILLWFGFSVFNVYFSQRPYTHYVLVGIASYVLLLGLIFHDKKSRILTLLLFLFFTVITVSTFKLKLQKNFSYYQNFLSFVIGNKPVRDYQAFFDSDVPQDNDIAQFIRKHKKDAKTIFLWGNAAQIYTLSGTLPPGRYTVAYHINSAKAISETEDAISVQKPKLIILLPDSPLPQISLSDYTYKATIDDATIYERTL